MVCGAQRSRLQQRRLQGQNLPKSERHAVNLTVPLPELMDDRPQLREWLERAARSPALLETLPDREATVRRYERRYVGRQAAA